MSEEQMSQTSQFTHLSQGDRNAFLNPISGVRQGEICGLTDSTCVCRGHPGQQCSHRCPSARLPPPSTQACSSCHSPSVAKTPLKSLKW